MSNDRNYYDLSSETDAFHFAAGGHHQITGFLGFLLIGTKK